jgi:hypothetical protein
MGAEGQAVADAGLRVGQIRPMHDVNINCRREKAPSTRAPLAQPNDDARDGQSRDNDTHDRNEYSTGKTENTSGVQGKLRLHEDVGGCARPRLGSAKVAPILTVEVHRARADSSSAMVIAQMAKADDIDAVERAVGDASHGLVNISASGFERSNIDDLGIRKPWLDRLVDSRRRAHIKRGWRRR